MRNAEFGVRNGVASGFDNNATTLRPIPHADVVAREIWLVGRRWTKVPAGSRSHRLAALRPRTTKRLAKFADGSQWINSIAR